MKKTAIIIVLIILVAIGAFFVIKSTSDKASDRDLSTEIPGPTDNQPVPPVEQNKAETVIGKSVEGRDITAFHFYGPKVTTDSATNTEVSTDTSVSGPDTEVLFVGGIHGGYEWNTVLVAFETIDFLKANPTVIPENVKVTVIPVLNPDGLDKVVGTPGRFVKTDVPTSQETVISGRFNANDVDLNRNFDCDWQAEGKWQNKTVSGGSAAFSEPESQAIKSYVETNTPDAVVVWYSAAGGVFASSCHNGVSTETRKLTKLFADASGYKAYNEFNFYEITGDMVNWLAKESIPAISVLLTNHTDTEWTKNRLGIEALLRSFAK